MNDVVRGHLARLGLLRLLSRLGDRSVAKSSDNILEAALRVVRSEAGGTLALLDRVSSLAELLQSSLVDLALRVRSEGSVRLVVLCALDAVLNVSYTELRLHSYKVEVV